MSLTIIIIGLFLLVSHFIPFYLVSHYQKKKKSKGKDFLDYFKDIAEKQQLKISQSEIWKNSYCIGIDTEANKLFYLKKAEADEEKVFIDINEIEKCKAVNITRTVKEGKFSSYTLVEHIELIFKYKNSRNAEKSLEFYNANGTQNMVLSNELELAEKWDKIINQKINNAT